jgi:[ribosomal protein S5]-alanine N-acetyltransferase
MSPQPFCIDTERLLLRTVGAGDAPVLQALMTPNISRWVAAWPYPLSSAAVDEIISTALSGFADARSLPMVIVERSNGSIVGWIKLEALPNGSRGAGLGYWVAETAQGRGFAFEASKAMLQVGFEKLDVDFIEAGAQPANEISHRVLVKLGMRPMDEREVFAPARQRYEKCRFWRVHKSDVVKEAGRPDQ